MRCSLALVVAFACAEPEPDGPRPSDDDTSAPEAHLTDPDVETTPSAPACDGSVPEALSGHNVLVVLLDDAGLESVAAYGLHPDPPHTPTLDALAESGIRFDRAYAYPLCSPSRAALLTGRYGRRTGVGNNVQLSSHAALPLDEVTFAEVALASPLGPYETAAVGKWHLAGETTPDLLLQANLQGFDTFQGTAGNLDGTVEDDGLDHDYFHWEQVTDGELEHVDVYNTTAVVDAAIERVAEMGEPWLMYVALHAAHGPMHVPPVALQGTGVGEDATDPELFGAVVEAADTELGRLLDAIDPAVRARTTVIVAGDNGTKGSNVRAPWALQGAKGSTADGGIRVPLVVAGPLVTAPGVSDALVHLVDVFPTIAEITCRTPEELPGPDGEPVVLDGQSLVPYLLDATTPGRRRSVYTELVGPPLSGPPYTVDKRVLADLRYKLVQDGTGGTETFHEVGPSPADESPDLLAAGLDPDQQAAYDLLSEELRAFVAELAYAHDR